MKVKAKVNLNYSGAWKHPGEEFEISTTDVDVLQYVDIVETPLVEPVEIPEPELPKRRGRPKKSDSTAEQI